MNRRSMLKLLGGAVAVAVLPIPLPADIQTEAREFYSDGEKAFIVMRTTQALRAGDFVLWRGAPIGVACDNARPGRRVLVQVYGPATVSERSYSVASAPPR